MHLSLSTAAVSLAEPEPEIMTDAPCSSAASATQYPMPDEPPKMRMRFPVSFDMYFRAGKAIFDNIDGLWG